MSTDRSARARPCQSFAVADRARVVEPFWVVSARRDRLDRRSSERVVEALELFGTELGTEVPVRGRKLGVAQEVTDEDGVGGASDQTSGVVPESVQANRPKASGGATEVEASVAGIRLTVSIDTEEGT